MLAEIRYLSDPERELCLSLDASGLNLVDLWLELLLGDTGCWVRRQLSCEVEFSVGFYGRAGIWIVEFVTEEKEGKI
jgi:hypothetical protein